MKVSMTMNPFSKRPSKGDDAEHQLVESNASKNEGVNTTDGQQNRLRGTIKNSLLERMTSMIHKAEREIQEVDKSVEETRQDMLAKKEDRVLSMRGSSYDSEDSMATSNEEKQVECREETNEVENNQEEGNDRCAVEKVRSEEKNDGNSMVEERQGQVVEDALPFTSKEEADVVEEADVAENQSSLTLKDKKEEITSSSDGVAAVDEGIRIENKEHVQEVQVQLEEVEGETEGLQVQEEAKEPVENENENETEKQKVEELIKEDEETQVSPEGTDEVVEEAERSEEAEKAAMNEPETAKTADSVPLEENMVTTTETGGVIDSATEEREMSDNKQELTISDGSDCEPIVLDDNSKTEDAETSGFQKFTSFLASSAGSVVSGASSASKEIIAAGVAGSVSTQGSIKQLASLVKGNVAEPTEQTAAAEEVEQSGFDMLASFLGSPGSKPDGSDGKTVESSDASKDTGAEKAVGEENLTEGEQTRAAQEDNQGDDEGSSESVEISQASFEARLKNPIPIEDAPSKHEILVSEKMEMTEMEAKSAESNELATPGDDLSKGQPAAAESAPSEHKSSEPGDSQDIGPQPNEIGSNDKDALVNSELDIDETSPHDCDPEVESQLQNNPDIETPPPAVSSEQNNTTPCGDLVNETCPPQSSQNSPTESPKEASVDPPLVEENDGTNQEELKKSGKTKKRSWGLLKSRRSKKEAKDAEKDKRSKKKTRSTKKGKSTKSDQRAAEEEMADMIWWSSEREAIEIIAVKANEFAQAWEETRLLEEREKQERLQEAGNLRTIKQMKHGISKSKGVKKLRFGRKNKSDVSLSSEASDVTDISNQCSFGAVVEETGVICNCSQLKDKAVKAKFVRELKTMAKELVEEGPVVVVRWLD